MILNKITRLRGFGRYACLGTSVLEALGRKYKMHNLQKGRVDYIEQSMQVPGVLCRPNSVKPHLARDYISPTIEQQSVLCPSFQPQVVFMDSFSELTDQMFRHKREGWTFCSNYLDLMHGEEFSDSFENLGLIDLSDLYYHYTRMIEIMQKMWGNIPIIYLHFPSVLETREKFVGRAEEIRKIVDSCAQFNNRLYSFSVPPSIVRHPEVAEPGLESFPYHYNQATYQEFADQIKHTPVLRRLF